MNISFNGNYYYAKDNDARITKKEQNKAISALNREYGKKQYIATFYTNEENPKIVEGIHVLTGEDKANYLNRMSGIPINYYPVIHRQFFIRSEDRDLDTLIK